MGKLRTLNDWYLTYQFDTAVSSYGNWIENKLTERDNSKDHKLKYTLEYLLYEPDESDEARKRRRRNAALGIVPVGVQVEERD